eukprot:CAMPEP_0119496184 /NCGR_PEP_ID=MMETSP1344-20130328/19593_1 /TAXON_ID=236787 /ORGANISM="Florenciella parvula, Strain CCMP2471" /LENGTH=57 /DNA_ID=CAMNT_0007531841 /DNA_START=126 /DNA_END=299 /DNA_ORIENTATION=-
MVLPSSAVTSSRTALAALPASPPDFADDHGGGGDDRDADSKAHELVPLGPCRHADRG